MRIRVVSEFFRLCDVECIVVIEFELLRGAWNSVILVTILGHAKIMGVAHPVFPNVYVSGRLHASIIDTVKILNSVLIGFVIEQNSDVEALDAADGRPSVIVACRIPKLIGSKEHSAILYNLVQNQDFD